MIVNFLQGVATAKDITPSLAVTPTARETVRVLQTMTTPAVPQLCRIQALTVTKVLRVGVTLSTPISVALLLSLELRLLLAPLSDVIRCLASASNPVSSVRL